ncbi:hypothetical protein ABTB40_20895, partial [Acinetobacter baumannii]
MAGTGNNAREAPCQVPPAEALAMAPSWSTIGASRDMFRELDECSIEARGSIRIATLRDTLLIP